MEASGDPEDKIETDKTHLAVSAPQGIQIGDRNEQRNFYGGTHHHHGMQAVCGPVVPWRQPPQAAAFQRRSPIRRAMKARQASSSTTMMTHILCGEAGAGKTQLVAAMFRDALRDGPEVAAWITAGSRTSILAAYQEIYTALNPGGALSDDGERISERLLGWLTVASRSWIFVLDDVGDPAELHGLWPTGPMGRVLVTTRRRDAAFRTHGTLTTIPVFTARESLNYLAARLAGPGLTPAVPAEVTDLAADLRHLPLALAHAASFIIDQDITCGTYRVLLADRHRKLSEVFPPNAAAGGDEYDKAVPAAWSLTVDRADAMSPEGLARPLLELIACLDPNGVPESVIASRAVRSYLATRASGSASTVAVATPFLESDIRLTVRNLHLLGLVVHDAADEVRTIRMHGLAQRAVLDRLASPDLAAVVRVAADSLVEAWPETAHYRNLAEA